MGDNEKSSSKGCHDFMNDKKWLFMIEGYGQSRHIIYKCYITIIYMFFFSMLGLSSYGMYMISPNKELIIASLHLFLNSTFALTGLTIRLLNEKTLMRSRDIILSGFYKYEGEPEDEEEAKMKDGMVGEIRWKCNQFICVFLVGSVSNLIFFPLTQWFLVTDRVYQSTVDITSPYLPLYIRLPFSTRSVSGFAAGFALNVLLLFYIYGTATVMNEVYVSCCVQLKVQLQVLNHSIANVQRRALRMFADRYRHTENTYEGLYRTRQYQNCLYRCLKSNIQHHQALLRFKEEILRFNGACLLLVAMIASVILATVLYLITKRPPYNILVNLVLTLFTEQTYVFYICYFGENVSNESSKLFESLYSISWYDYDKKFNRALNVFMLVTRHPIRVKTILLDLTASLETYGIFMTTMYKVMNILRQSDQ